MLHRQTRLDLIGRQRHIERVRQRVDGGSGIRVEQVGEAYFRIREVGSGPSSVVLIPDPPNVIEHYDDLISRLTRSARVICFEALGFGFSVPPPRFGFTLDEHVEQSAMLLRHLEVERAILAWPCVAAYIALRLALVHPELASALVCSQAPSWREEQAWARRLDPKGVIATPYVGQIVVRAARRPIARSWYDVAAVSDNGDDMASIGLQALRRGAAYSLASTFQAFLGRSEEFVRLDLPSIFVWGALDRSHRKTDRGSCRALARDARLVTFDRSAHFPDLEEPARFASVLNEAAAMTR